MQVAAVLCGLAYFAIMSLISLRFFVVADAGARRGKLWISLLAGPGAIYVLWALACSDTSPVWAGAGIASFLLALWLFFTAWRANRGQPLDFAGSARMPQHFVSAGPYQWIRHPFYASYILAWLAGSLSTHDPVAIALFVAMTSIYARAASNEERAFLKSYFRLAYASYMRETGMFLPRGDRGAMHPTPKKERPSHDHDDHRSAPGCQSDISPG